MLLLSHAVAELRAGGVDVVSIATGGDAGHGRVVEIAMGG
jgi:hypothetical protein